jgi:lysophospholipase L1-like esterase
MKTLKFIFCFLFSLMISGQFSQAQTQQTPAAAVKTPEQMAKEYAAWAKIRDDWPNLARYRDANAKLGPPAASENRVVFMGNSITDSWIRDSPDFFKGKPYIDRGISGQTSPQMLARFRADVIALKPRVVVILAGINDIAGNTGPSTLEMIEDNIASMTELAKANGIRVVLSSILPAFDFPWKQGMQPAEKVVAVNSWIKSYASKNNSVYLDFFSAFADERKGMPLKYSADGIHPNKDGYKIMEPLAEKAIAEALKQPMLTY